MFCVWQCVCTHALPDICVFMTLHVCVCVYMWASTVRCLLLSRLDGWACAVILTTPHLIINWLLLRQGEREGGREGWGETSGQVEMNSWSYSLTTFFIPLPLSSSLFLCLYGHWEMLRSKNTALCFPLTSCSHTVKGLFIFRCQGNSITCFHWQY